MFGVFSISPILRAKRSSIRHNDTLDISMRRPIPQPIDSAGDKRADSPNTAVPATATIQAIDIFFTSEGFISIL